MDWLRVPASSPASAEPPSPPYRTIRSLRLLDVPSTPKTIVHKSKPARARLFPAHFAAPQPMAASSPYLPAEEPVANVNPFNVRKRSRSKASLASFDDSSAMETGLAADDDEDTSGFQPKRRVNLHEASIARFHEEFCQLDVIGKGNFGYVYKCINRLDGCVYAIKKSRNPIAGSYLEKWAMNEVYAHAVLGSHERVVRYYSAWTEDMHMIIQNEYCNGGSLADLIEGRRRALDPNQVPQQPQQSQQSLPFAEAELRRILRHLAEGLRYIHSMQLVHMDIKPENVFISRRETLYAEDSLNESFEEREEAGEEVCYKIGDLGHVTCVQNPDVEEGDCRYMSKEVLNMNYRNLPKADIFSLGLTLFETASLLELPKNGDLWHEYRDKGLPDVKGLGRDFCDLLREMAHLDPEQRPTAHLVLQHPVVSAMKSGDYKAQLHAMSIKNELLGKQLEEAVKMIKQQQQQIEVYQNTGRRVSNRQTSASKHSTRLLLSRSNSTSTF